MAELKIHLSDELDKKFRKLAMNIFGYGRGSLSEAAVEALSSWCREQESRKDDQGKIDGSSLESDPVARAEERPGLLPPAKQKDSHSPLQQDKMDESLPQTNKDKDEN